jgi:hypothetical protein
MPFPKITLRVLRCTAFLGTMAFPAGTARADDAALPGPGFPASHYESLWTKSPFAVASADAEAGPSSPDYSLVGIAEVDGIAYANLIEKQNHEHFILTTDKPARGLKLVSISRGHDTTKTSAVVQKDGQTLTLTLDVPAVTTMAPTPQIPMPGATNFQQQMVLPPNFPPRQFPPNAFIHSHPIRVPPRPGSSP